MRTCVCLLVLWASMRIPLVDANSAALNVPLALNLLATVSRAVDPLLTCWMDLVWLCALMVTLTRMVNANLVMIPVPLALCAHSVS